MAGSKSEAEMRNISTARIFRIKFPSLGLCFKNITRIEKSSIKAGKLHEDHHCYPDEDRFVRPWLKDVGELGGLSGINADAIFDLAQLGFSIINGAS